MSGVEGQVTWSSVWVLIGGWFEYIIQYNSVQLHIDHLFICITGNNDETETGELKEEPRAINFTITNRTEKQKHDVGRKNKGLDLNKEPTSASRLIPGHISYYDENSKGNSLINENSKTTKIAVGVIFFYVFASYY